MPTCSSHRQRLLGHPMRALLALFAILIASHGACFAMSDTIEHTPAIPIPADSEEHDRIVQTALAPALEELGTPASLAIGRLQMIEDWVFLLSELRAPGGGPFDFSDTRLADQAAAGSRSPVYVALLRRQADDSWQIVARSLGPGDVIWESWSQEYGAPPNLFALD